jgi:hypothetical protein
MLPGLDGVAWEALHHAMGPLMIFRGDPGGRDL